MQEGPVISTIAALFGDPARANMLTALMDGRALTASELARAGGVALSTASGHLARMESAGLLTVEKQGRHRYYRLSGVDVAAVVEALMGLAQRTGAARVRTGPRDPALRAARVCYDHLAGERAVALRRAMVANGWLDRSGEGGVTPLGRARLERIGLDIAALERGRRPLCRACLDWSERESHLAGALGAACLDLMVTRRWAWREPGRVIAFTAAGGRALSEAFEIAPGD